MEKITQEYDFLYKLLKSDPEEAERLLLEASPEQKSAIKACLLFRKEQLDIPLKKSEKKILALGVRSKRLPKFFKTYRKFMCAVIMCTLSKIVSEAILYICDV